MIVRTVAAVFFYLIISGCGKELSREKAADLIANAAPMVQLTSAVPIYNPNEIVSQARKQGIEITENRLLFLAAPDQILRGDDLLAEVEPKIDFLDASKAFLLRLRKPIKLVITVTGITDSQEGRRADFTWTQEGLPPLIRRFATNGG